MAAIDFPNAPAVNDLFAAPNGVIYQWTGTLWLARVVGPVGFSVPALQVFATAGSYTNTVAKPPMAAPTVDVGSYWNAGSSRWTPPAGVYLISAVASCTAASTTAGMRSYLRKNGVTIATGVDTSVGSGGIGTAAIAVVVQANGSDFFELFASFDASSTIDLTGTYLAAYGIAPAAGQNLTGVVPTGQKFLSGSGTYIWPAGVKWIRVRMKGGGGGGFGVSSGGGIVQGSNGGDTSFNSIVAKGGSTGTAGGFAPGAGGTGGAGTATLRMAGAPGGGGLNGQATAIGAGGSGGGNGGGAGGSNGSGANSPGANGVANSGGGGGGAANGQSASFVHGQGGGEGEYVELVINGPAANYNYIVGAGGLGGVSTSNGGTGGSGVIFVEEYT